MEDCWEGKGGGLVGEREREGERWGGEGDEPKIATARTCSGFRYETTRVLRRRGAIVVVVVVVAVAALVALVFRGAGYSPHWRNRWAASGSIINER